MMPPHILERLMAFLLPGPAREEVLGDLHERYRSPWGYLREAGGALPRIIWSRIRRTADGPLTLALAAQVCLGYVAADWYFSGVLDVVRIAIPVVALMLGILLADAYVRRPNPFLGPAVGAAMAIAAVSLLVTLSLWANLAAASFGWVLTTATRVWRTKGVISR